MKKAIMGILGKHLELKEMENALQEWYSIENDPSIYVPVDYSYNMVVYQNAYFSDVYEKLIDLSIVIYNGGRAVGIWPLSVTQNNQVYEIGSWGGILLPPLLRENAGKTESKRKILRKCIEALEEVCAFLYISQYRSAGRVLHDGTSLWLQMLFDHGAICCGVDNECFVDLSLKESEILAKMRRTNKYSIEKSAHLWKNEIITRHTGTEKIAECFEKFQKLHTEVSGRETRSRTTWDIQCNGVSNQNDFVVMLYNEMEELIGASLFSTTGSAGVYSVGAYRRELFDKPVAHVSQWLAIKYMQELGIRWYYIGKRPYPGSWDHPNEKEISISHFKEGFATNIFLRPYLEYRLKNP